VTIRSSEFARETLGEIGKSYFLYFHLNICTEPRLALP